ncbi:50S ribosomal protein L18 [Candidatus Falkowbacteria bacterium RIFOXYA2_FULL_47_9]|uniref:Large ribosomal subunit protein uL18 n=1 Tax=Candidatus Falkowbacteria bacterium RIFOXYA2_FULL_47_9 TaxID=1797995 RepID=A0A1F5SNF4_9BACT|nr:MAG: 50S ribosomal protein L18 [Candidatus Falkowbacteria bacterium RIFOXYA2_FULL_47_9]
MNKYSQKIKQNKLRRKARSRVKIFGTAARPRVSVFRSNRSVYVQLIDDEKSQTIVSVNMKELSGKTKTEMSAVAGKLLAQKAKEKAITRAVFDRGGNRYHGRIKAIADAARAAGLEI